MDFIEKAIEQARNRTSEERNSLEDRVRDELIIAGIPREQVTVKHLNQALEVRGLDSWNDEGPKYFGPPTFDELSFNSNEGDEEGLGELIALYT